MAEAQIGHWEADIGLVQVAGNLEVGLMEGTVAVAEGGTVAADEAGEGAVEEEYDAEARTAEVGAAEAEESAEAEDAVAVVAFESEAFALAEVKIPCAEVGVGACEKEDPVDPDHEVQQAVAAAAAAEAAEDCAVQQGADSSQPP